MVNLLIAPDADALSVPGVVTHGLGPGLRHGRHAHARPRTTSRAQPGRDGRGVRAGAQPRVLGDLPVRHDDQGPGPGEHQLRQLLQRRRPPRRSSFDYLLANPPFGVEWKKVKDEVEDEHETLGDARPLRRGPAAHQRRLAALPPAHDLEDEAGRRQRRGRLAASRSSSTARRCSRARPSRASPRSAGGSWRTTGWRRSSPCPTSSSTTPASPRTSGSSPTARPPDHKGKVVLLDARDQWEKMRKSLGDKRKELDADEQITATSRGCTREALDVAGRPGAPAARQGEGLRQRGLRLPAHHRRTALKLRFEVTEETLAALAAAKPVQKLAQTRGSSSTAVQPLVGSAWATKAEALGRAAQDAVVAGRRCCGPPGAPFMKALRRDRRGARPRGRGPDGQGRARAGPGAARLRERAAGRGHRGVPAARGAAARPGRVDRPHEDEDRLRDPVHAALLRVQAAAAAGGDRRGAEGAGGARFRRCWGR